MRLVSFDYETHQIKPGMIAPRSVCMSWYDGDEAGLVGRLDALNLLRKWLRDPNVSLGGHNVCFDLGVAVADDPELMPLVLEAFKAGRIWCTKVRQQLLDIARGELMASDDEGNGKPNYRRREGANYLAGLALTDLLLWWFDEVRDKTDTWRLHYNELDGVAVEDYPEEAKQYVFDDARDAWRIYEAQETYITLGDSEYLPEAELPNQAEQMRAAWALHLMSMWGMRTDAKATAQLREVLEAEQVAARDVLKDSGIFVPKTKTGTEIKKSMKVIYGKMLAAYAARGAPCPMTNGGSDKLQPDGSIKAGRPPVPSTDKEALLDSGDEDLIALATSEAGRKLLNTYVPVLESGTRNPICAIYNVLVETGRTSCRKPNMQNPPRAGGVRSCFVPSAGHVMCSVDFDTAELRSLAQICYTLVGYSKLGDALKRGEDPHLLLAAQMLHLSVEETVKRYKAGDKATDEMRQFCKVGNFGFPGGLGEATFISYAKGYGIDVSMAQATALREAWFKTWSEMRPYFNKISAMTGADGGSVMQYRIVGGKRVLHRRRGNVFFTQAANGLFQGLTADGAKEALWQVCYACYSAKPGDLLYGVRPVAFLHDEIIAEIPYDESKPEVASAAAYEMSRIMREAMQSWVPDVPIKCAPAMFRRWLKGAKPAFVGKVLVPSNKLESFVGGVKSITWVHDKGEQCAI